MTREEPSKRREKKERGILDEVQDTRKRGDLSIDRLTTSSPPLPLPFMHYV